MINITSNPSTTKMSLPSEIWSIILLKITDSKSCKNLYKSLPKSIQLSIEKDYAYHYGMFKQLLCIAVNKEIALYYKENKIKSFLHEEYVYMVRFRPNKTEIIFSDNSGDIFLWDYLTNNIEKLVHSTRGRLSPLLPMIIKIYFHVSPCGEYLIIHPFPISDHQLYKFKIDTKKKSIMPFFIESINTNFTIAFNPKKDEFVLSSYYLMEIGRFQLKMNIINSNTLVSSYFNTDFYSPCYDESGDLYLAKKNKGIYKLVNYEVYEEIIKCENYISLFVVKNGFIYYLEIFIELNLTHIKKFNIEKMECEDTYQIPFAIINNLQVSKDNKKLIFLSDSRIIFFNIESKIMEKTIDGSHVHSVNSSENAIIADFCIKKFYKNN